MRVGRTVLSALLPLGPILVSLTLSGCGGSPAPVDGKVLAEEAQDREKMISDIYKAKKAEKPTNHAQ